MPAQPLITLGGEPEGQFEQVAVEAILISGVFFAFMVAAALFDAWKFIIPNTIPVVLTLLFLVVALIWNDRVSLFEHIGAGLLVFCVGAVIFRFGVLGGGDIKLLTAVAFWVGWDYLAVYLLVVAIFGGGLTLFLLALRHLLRRLYRSRSPNYPLPRILRAGEKIPYAIAIGAAGIWIAPYLPLLTLAA